MLNNPSVVSIVIPVYNASLYLEQCISSVLDQDYIFLDVILVDDGSTDGSSNICDKYVKKDCRVKVVHKSNGGVSSARNKGLELSSGEWVTFVDSDDHIDNDYISNMIANADCDFVASHIKAEGWSEWVDVPLLDCKWDNLNDFLLNNLHRMNFMACKLFKKSIIEDFDIKFDENISYGEDTLFVYQYLRHIASAVTLSKASYHYNCYNTVSLSKANANWSRIAYTINRICMTIEEIEQIHNINCIYAKSVIVNNYLSNYLQFISRNLSLKKIRESLHAINQNKYVLMQINDRTSWIKSGKRRIFDYSMKNKQYLVGAIMLYLSKYI